MNSYFKKALLLSREKYWEEAFEEWKEFNDEQKLYISYLYKTKKKYLSKSNSRVMYSIGITDTEPQGNISRRNGGGTADIDMDFCEIKRADVINYVKEKYGHDRVAHIGTYGSMKAKAAIRDVTRVLGKPYLLGDKLAKMTLEPIAGKPQPLSTCYEKVAALGNIRNGKDSDEKEVLIWAEKIENRMRSFGTHASGVLIAKDKVSKNIPLYPGKDGTPTTQFEMNTVEECGLIKFDFLGLRALTTIDRCTKLIAKRHNVEIDPLQIPVDDPATYKTLQVGDVSGIFQMEGSSGIRDLLVQIRPNNLEDIAILVALYRPGPLGCLSGDTQILTGIVGGYSKNRSPKRNFRYQTIKELYDSYQRKQSGQSTHHKVSIWSVDETQHTLVHNKINKVYASGQQEVFQINIQTGLSQTQKKYTPTLNRSQRKTNQIKATKNHRFFTLDGWKRLEDIAIGEYISITHHSCFGAHRSKKHTYGKKNFANIAFRHYQYRCVFCNWNQGSLDVNHIEGSRNTDNSPDNLSFLCPNHHRMYSEGTISKAELIKEKEQYRLPYTEQIMFVKYLGKESCGIEETFDISVRDPHHNFLAGDFVVHNSDMLQHYLKVRAGQAEPQFLIKELKPILSVTDGMLIYQEQILEICKQLAGYTMAEADLMRRAVGKKKEKEMEAQHEKFIAGFKKHGLSEQDAAAVWHDIEAFSAYGFNKTVDKDTLVYTANGIKRIEDIKRGDSVFSWKKDNTIQNSIVLKRHDHGQVPIWKIEFDDGTIEKCTLDHKWLTEFGQLPLWQIMQMNIPVWGSSVYKKISIQNTTKRQDVRSKNYKTRLRINSTINVEFQKQLWRTYLSKTPNPTNCNSKRKLDRHTLLRKPIQATYLGLRQGYDLEVDHPDHNFFLASGHCCSNSHAVCYGYIGYQMAWLKTHYLLEFMCACLISDSDEVDKIINYIGYCREKGIEVLGPSINESGYNFSITQDNKSIRFGLSAIKNLGKPVQEIIDERDTNGPFIDIVDFASRVDLGKINKRKLESLVLAGAFDDLSNCNRASLIGAVADIMRHKTDEKKFESKMTTWIDRIKKFEIRQQELVAWMALTKTEQKATRTEGKKKPNKLKFPEKPVAIKPVVIPSMIAMTPQDRLGWEKELLGYFISGHPLDNIKESSHYTIAKIKEEVFERTIESGFRTRLVAIPSIIKVITTKKNKRKMAYVTLEDKTGTIQTVAMSHIYAKCQELINIKTPALYDVELEVAEGDIEKVVKLIIHRVRMLPSVREFRNRPIELIVPIDSARKVTDILVQIRGEGPKVQFSVESKEGNLWKIGTLTCKGTKSDLERTLKESI